MAMKSERFLTFFLDTHLCAFRVHDVREINQPRFSDRSPTTMLRGETILNVDLREKLGLGSVSLTQSSRVIIVKTHKGKTATLVDAIHQVVDLYADQWESLSSSDTRAFPNSSAFLGVAMWKGQTVLLLDIGILVARADSQNIAI